MFDALWVIPLVGHSPYPYFTIESNCKRRFVTPRNLSPLIQSPVLMFLAPFKSLGAIDIANKRFSGSPKRTKIAILFYPASYSVQTNSLWSITEIKFLLNCCCRDKSVPFNLSKYDSVHLSARFPFSSSTLLSVQRVTVFMKADYSPNGVPISAHLCRNGLYRASLITISNNLSLFDV